MMRWLTSYVDVLDDVYELVERVRRARHPKTAIEAIDLTVRFGREDPHIIGPGVECQRVARGPEKPFRLRDVVIAPTSSLYFDVVSIRVGRDQEVVWSDAPVPATAFDPLSSHRIADMVHEPWVRPNANILLTVRNVSKKPRELRAYALVERLLEGS